MSLFQWPFLGRQQRLMKSRTMYTKDSFSNFFLSRGVSKDIVDEVWAILVDAAVTKDFKPYPEDELLKTFGLAEEDLDEDIVLVLLERCACRIPTPDEMETMEPLQTVADLVEFISRMKQQ